MNLASVVRDHADRNPDKTAITFRSERVSYLQLVDMIDSIAAFLVATGIGSGDRVGLCMPEHPLHLVAHFAVGRIGAVILPMDHRWTDPEKRAAAEAFQARVVLTDGAKVEGVRTATLDIGALNSDTGELPPVPEGDVDLLVSLSSGTTGRPKGAIVTHANFYQRFVSQWHAIGYGEDDCFAILTPFYFGAGRSFGMSLLCAGGSVCIAPPPLKPPEIVEILTGEGITATFMPPTLLRRLFDLHEPGQPPLLGNLQYLVVSGEPLFTDEAHECIEKICPNLYSYYASSEGGGISVLRAEEFTNHAATVGKPTYQTQVEIVDENDVPTGDGIVGRLRYRGPGVSTRFLDSDGSEQRSGAGGWFYPGDLAERLDSGHIALRGRDKDVIIRGGVNIYPAEIEATLLGHESVTEAAVIGVDDGARGQVIRAFVAGDDLEPEALAEYCRERLAPYKVPQEFQVLSELPKQSSGKVDKKQLQELSQ